jgi:hypothetical protein
VTSDLAVPTFTKNVKVGQPPAKVSDIGKMGDQQRIHGVAIENSLQLLETASVVHLESLPRSQQISDFFRRPAQTLPPHKRRVW